MAIISYLFIYTSQGLASAIYYPNLILYNKNGEFLSTELSSLSLLFRRKIKIALCIPMYKDS